MNAFSRTYTPVVDAEALKTKKAPKPVQNVFDIGTGPERAAQNAKPLPIERFRAPRRVSTM